MLLSDSLFFKNKRATTVVATNRMLLPKSSMSKIIPPSLAGMPTPISHIPVDANNNMNAKNALKQKIFVFESSLPLVRVMNHMQPIGPIKTQAKVAKKRTGISASLILNLTVSISGKLLSMY